MILRRIVRFLDDRLGGARFLRSSLNKAFPDHWSFLLGEIALYCFVLLVASGIYLTFFFRPDPTPVIYDGAYEPLRGVVVSQAYRSMLDLSFEVRAGLVMRQLHHWAALVFLATVTVHLMRVFFTGAFRKPRELNWMVGVTLLVLAMFNGFFGYSMADDLLSGTGLRIAYSIALSVPVVGTWFAFFVFGGEFPSHDMLPRLFVLHVLIVPALIALLLGLHVAILWRQGHSQFRGPGRTESNVVGQRLWPAHAMRSTGLFLIVAAALAALAGLVQINPVWLYGPFDPSTLTAPAQPDWYLGWIDGALRLFPAWEIRAFGYTVANPFFPGVLLPGLTFAVLYAWPFLEARVTGDREPHHLLDRPRDKPVRTAIGVCAVVFYTVLVLAGSNDIIAAAFGLRLAILVNVVRAALLVLPVVAGVLALVACRALQVSDAPGLGHVPASAFARVLRPGRPPAGSSGS